MNLRNYQAECLEKKIKEEQEQLRLEEINLFNADLNNITGVSSLDWFFTEIYKKDIAIISVKSDIDIFIFKLNGTFVAFKYTKLPEFKYKIEQVSENDNLKELVE